MEFVQLKYFQAIAEAQHMTNAAHSLHVAQSALSRTLRNLEEELGLKLFDRVGKHIYLNSNGKILLRHTNIILAEIDNAYRELAERQGQAEMIASLSIQAGSKLLPGLIRGFKKKHPNIILQIMQQDNSVEEKSDIIIYSTMEQVEDDTTVCLLEEDICLAMPSSNPLSRKRSIRLKEVAQEAFIGLHKDKSLRVITDEFCAMAGFLPNVVIESDSPATVRELIAVEVGCAFIPTVTWQGLESDPSVALLDIEEPRCSRYVNMSWRKNRYATKASKLLRQYIVEYFAEVEQAYRLAHPRAES